MSLSTRQLRLKGIAETIMLELKPTRKVLIEEMKEIVSSLNSDQLIEVIKTIDSPIALNFLIPTGVHGEAQKFLFRKLSKKAEEKKVK